VQQGRFFRVAASEERPAGVALSAVSAASPSSASISAIFQSNFASKKVYDAAYGASNFTARALKH
jgi:hypothetical protein